MNLLRRNVSGANLTYEAVMSTHDTLSLTAETRVHDLLAEQPSLLSVFLRNGMNCPGCPFDGFHTIADACREHHRDLPSFMQALRIAMNGRGA